MNVSLTVACLLGGLVRWERAPAVSKLLPAHIHLQKAELSTPGHAQTPSNKLFKFLGVGSCSRIVKSKSTEVEARSAGGSREQPTSEHQFRSKESQSDLISRATRCLLEGQHLSP